MNKAIKLKINNVTYKVKYTLRALFIYERITNKPFEITTMLDNYVFFYSLLLASNPDKLLDFDDFIDAIDNDPQLVNQLNALVEQHQKEDSIFEQEEKNGEKKSSE